MIDNSVSYFFKKAAKAFTNSWGLTSLTVAPLVDI